MVVLRFNTYPNVDRAPPITEELMVLSRALALSREGHSIDCRTDSESLGRLQLNIFDILPLFLAALFTFGRCTPHPTTFTHSIDHHFRFNINSALKNILGTLTVGRPS